MENIRASINLQQVVFITKKIYYCIEFYKYTQQYLNVTTCNINK